MKCSPLTLVVFLTTLNLKSIVAQTLKPGDTDPKAKVLQADVMQDFNNGAAIITKGNAYALIDMNGNMLAPYNQYDFYYARNRTSNRGNGMFSLGPRKGAINAKGQLIGQGLDLTTGSRDNGGYIFTRVKDVWLAVNADDQRFPINVSGMSGVGNLAEGLMSFTAGNAMNSKTGFKNLKDQTVIPATFDIAVSFSDGMASVGCKNEFGQIKYGFINKEGKQVIPCIFTNKPSDFYCGRALVYPKDYTEFEYAYINKKGEIAIKYTHELYQKYGNLSGGFFNGYTFGNVVMDTAGKIYTYPQFFAKYGVANPADKKLKLEFPTHREEWTDGQVFMFSRFDNNNRAASTTGFIDVATNKVIEGPFFNTNFYFDPVSKLAYAEMHGKDETNKIVKKGYINRQGIFVIVAGEESKW